MRSANVYWNGQLAGILTQHGRSAYEFAYNDQWWADDTKPAISLTLPKTQQVYRSDHLFPFFFNLLSEGVNRHLQSRLLKIDEQDHFGLLLATAATDSIGAVTVEPIEKNQ